MTTEKVKRPARRGPRRPRGEGSITHEGDRWIVRLWAGKQRLQRTRRTQAEALKALDELHRLAALPGARKRYTVDDAFDAFLLHGAEVRGWAPATTAAYESVARLYIRPALGKRQLLELSVPDVQRMIDRLAEQRLSGAYIGHVRATLRACLAHAMRQELVFRNVAALASPPRVRREEQRALSNEEIGGLLAALDGERLRPLIVMGVVLGLRRGELMALRWADCDLDRARLTVRRTGKRIGGRYVEGQPKSERSRRIVALPVAVVTLLRAQRAVVAEEQLRLGPAWHDEGYVFPGQDGGPVGASTIRKALDRALARAGLPYIRIHDLRHSAATALLVAGGTLHDVQNMLGHTSYALTANLYAHVLDGQRQTTAARIDAAFGGAIGG